MLKQLCYYLSLSASLSPCSISASVGSLSMTGVPKPDHQTMILSSDVPIAGTEAKPLINFQLEVHPLNKPWMDASIRAALQPMQITYDFVCYSN